MEEVMTSCDRGDMKLGLAADWNMALLLVFIIILFHQTWCSVELGYRNFVKEQLLFSELQKGASGASAARVKISQLG